MTSAALTPPGMTASDVPLLSNSMAGNRDNMETHHETPTILYTPPAATPVRQPSNLKNKCVRISDFLALQYIVPILVLIAYSFLGAWMFSYVEHENEVKVIDQKAKYYIEQRRLLREHLSYSESFPNPRAMRREAFEWFEKNLVCDSVTGNDTKWDMWSGMFYAASLYTTIGYGNIAPVTNVGRALSIPYTFFGVPLVLLILRDLGRMFFAVMATTCQLCTFRRNRKFMPAPGYVSTQINEVSLVPLVGILVVWLPLWALIYMWWEPQWDYLKAFYFVFLSFTTVGLGDLMPTGSKNMVFSYFLVIFGLALLSMIWAAAQAKIEATFYRYRAVIDAYYARRAVLEPVEGEVYFEDSSRQPPRSPDGRIARIPDVIHQRMSCIDRLYYAAMMDTHRQRLLLERCRMNLRKTNKMTQTGGVLRKSSSSERRPVQFQGDRNRSPTKTVNFQMLDHQNSNSDPRIPDDWQQASSSPVVGMMQGDSEGNRGVSPPRYRMPANPATAASMFQQKQKLPQQQQTQRGGYPQQGGYSQPTMSPGQRNPRLVGRGKSPDSDTFSTNSFTTAVTSFPADGAIEHYYDERRPTIASSSSDAMLNDFLFPEVNLVTRDPVTSRVMQMQQSPQQQNYRRGSSGLGGPFA